MKTRTKKRTHFLKIHVKKISFDVKILIFLRDKIFWKSVAEVSGHFPGG